jgi:hypothetical protein
LASGFLKESASELASAWEWESASGFLKESASELASVSVWESESAWESV